MASVRILKSMSYLALRRSLFHRPHKRARPFFCKYCGSMVAPPTDKRYTPKIEKLVDEIAGLTLIETSDLNELLKKKLNIQDTPMMMGAVSAAAKPDEEEEETVQVPTQMAFTVKLQKYDESKKVALIKELKSKIEGMNLVQAKKFVESAPAVIQKDIPKEDADKLVEALKAVGAECTVE